jgi:hypothetical protein
LIKVATMYEDAGLPAVLKAGPQGAQPSWDSMLVVFADESLRTIRKVLLYNTEQDKFVGEFQ